MLELSNASIEVTVNPDHGGEIMSVRRPGRPNVLAAYDWRAPLEAGRSTTYGDEGSDWLSEYRGGWQELFPNGGAACTVAGVPLPFHGEVSRARWRVDEQSEDALTISTPTRLPLVLERRMRLASDHAALIIEETVRADANVATPFLWGHHPAFQATQGARIDMPSGTVLVADADYVTDLSDIAPGSRSEWPNLPGKHGDSVQLDRVPAGPLERLAYLTQLGSQPWAAIRDLDRGEGVALAWDGNTFKSAWFWWEIEGPGHPWHGRSRIVAIEPNTTFPSDGLAAAHERGEAHLLPAGGEHHTWLTVSLFDADERPVTGVTRDGSVLR
jgi:galactose mutarotase-like enzyme